MFNKILVALDTHEDCEPIFKQALALAQSNEASLMLLGVVSFAGDGHSPLMPYGGMVDDLLAVDITTWKLSQERFDAARRLGHRLLSGFATEATAAGVKAEAIQGEGSPGREICDRAKFEQVDLIVVGSHSRKGLREVFMGSVSNYVMHHAPCSVLVVRQLPSEVAYSDAAAAILLDIEGTIVPKGYAAEVLSPFVRDNVELFLETRGRDADVQADLTLLREAYLAESEPMPPWEGDEPVMAVPYIHDLIEYERDLPALQSLESKIWAAGYESGQLSSLFFLDMLPAFQRWQSAGKSIYVFSSESMQIQKLILRYIQKGDLAAYISGYFEVTDESKEHAKRYRQMARQIADDAPALPISRQRILLVSGDRTELKAARTAGFQTLYCNRPGRSLETNLEASKENAEAFTKIEDFDNV